MLDRSRTPKIKEKIYANKNKKCQMFKVHNKKKYRKKAIMFVGKMTSLEE